MYLKIYFIRDRIHRGEDLTGCVVASSADKAEVFCIAAAA
jgi:hypothetical protein